MKRSLLAALTLFIAVGANAQTAPVRWVLVDEYPVTSLPGEGDLHFARGIEQKLGARLAIDVLADAKAGYKSREQLKAVAQGKVKMANSFAGALGDDNAFFLLSSLPFLAANAGEARRLYDLARPRYEAVLKTYNQKLLFATPWPASGVWAKVPADTPEAVASLKIRTYDKTGTELFKALGANARVVSFTDLPALLHASEIDAVLSSGDGGAGRKLWEALPNFTEINYAVPLSLATVNLDAWNTLSAEDQKIVLEVAADTEARQWQAMEGRVTKNYERMRENGMTITTKVTPALAAKFKDTASAVIVDWEVKAGAEGREVLERFRKGSAK